MAGVLSQRYLFSMHKLLLGICCIVFAAVSRYSCLVKNLQVKVIIIIVIIIIELFLWWRCDDLEIYEGRYHSEQLNRSYQGGSHQKLTL
jgi:hypothetical protein